MLAGEQLTDADLRVVSISADDSFAVGAGVGDRTSIVGQYAKVRLVEGSLLVADSVQARPLVDPSKVLMSVPVPLSGVPTGLREGSRLVLVVTPESAGDGAPPVLVEATVAAVPRNLGELCRWRRLERRRRRWRCRWRSTPEAAATVGPAEAVAVAVLAPDAPFPSSSAGAGRADVTPVPTSAAGG